MFYLPSALMILFRIAGAKSQGNCVHESYSYANCRVMRELIKPAFLLAVVSLCFFQTVLQWQNGVFREFAAAILSLQWTLLVCLAVWCGSFIFLTFSRRDLPLIGLLVIAIAVYFISYKESSPGVDSIILLAGVTLGKGAAVLLKADGRWKMEDGVEKEVRSQESEVGNTIPEIVTRHSSLVTFLVGLVLLLAFGSWWHLDMTNNFYQGPRWMGLWNNPNIYGMLMGAGVVLAIGLLATNSKLKIKNSKLGWVLFIAAGMMGAGLIFSYSRGAWVGTAVGLLYLAKVYGKFKWRSLKLFLFSGFCFLLLIFGVWFFWNTPQTAPWCFQRLDFSRGSVQHRVAAWRGAFQMMRDHPLGVGWNKAVEMYEKNYSPPEGGAAAITMNSYLMLGTQLGIPALVCFLAYAGLALKGDRSWKLGVGKNAECGTRSVECISELRIKTACRAGAIMLLVAFWFDGGLFTLATASVFWILLELGSSQVEDGRWKMGGEKTESGKQKTEMDQSLVPPSQTCGKTSTSAATN